mmetsp:Transcript_19356/g.35028  ORF Transcript_19356/g.35028 Transcript_19356/m.35028 type:complete len:363 (+) Transcript_19356:263-1351(+)
MTAISVGGIALVIIPLLSLTANQLERIKHAVQQYNAIYAYHLDKFSKHDTKEKLILKMDEFEYDLLTTMFILCSPQYLAENIDFCNALLRYRDRKVLRLIAVHEVNIYAIQGSTFREPIHIVGRDFFSKLYGKSHQFLPLFLAMTATMPLELIKTFSKLTSINWEDPCHLMCSTPQEFQQQYIDMDFHVQADVGSCLDSLLPVLVAKKVNAEGTIVNKNSHGCVFVNFKSERSKWAGVLKEKLADKLIDVNVIQIRGDQDKHEKFAFTRLFTASVKMQNYNPFMLFATAAVNTDIDQTLIKWVMTVGLPRCLTTLLQERGRNRSEGFYLIVTDWKLFSNCCLLFWCLPQNKVKLRSYPTTNT